MATNNLKIFDENKGNIMSTEEYGTNNQRLNGVQQGIASSMLQNKTLYQLSLVAYAIGQMMVNNGLDANDDNAVSAFVGNLANTIVQKVVDKASTAEAQAGTDANKFMTPATTRAAINVLKATSSMATAGTDTTHWMTPALVKQMIGDLTISENTLKLWIISSIGTNESVGEIDISATANPSSGFMGYDRYAKGVNSVTYTFNFSFLDKDAYVYRFRSWNLLGGSGGGGSGSRSGNVPYTIKLNGNNIKTGSFDYATLGISIMFNSLLQFLQENLCSEYKVYIKKNDILTINLDFSSISRTGTAHNSADIGANPTAKVDSVILPT